MSNIVILGGGMVGATMAIDLARHRTDSITVVDARQEALVRVAERVEGLTGTTIATRHADLSQAAAIHDAVGGADVVLGALASTIGFATLRAIIEAGKPYCDISFMPENALELDALARERGVTAVVDCGVAPGLSNMLAGHAVAELDECKSIEIYVGGLPRVRTWPFEYKAAFSPQDVLEEYTRPSRMVEHGEVVVREALSEPELMEFDDIGTLEAFNTDGLRSLVETLDVPFMKEKTLRYPGHIELMRVFRDTGLFDKETIQVGDARVRPLDVISQLMFPKWSYEEGEVDLTVMRVTASGLRAGQPVRLSWDLLDEYDPATGCSSMSRTTAYPATIVAGLLLEGRIPGPGVVAPEHLGGDQGIFSAVLEGLETRGVRLMAAEDAGT